VIHIITIVKTLYRKRITRNEEYINILIMKRRERNTELGSEDRDRGRIKTLRYEKEREREKREREKGERRERREREEREKRERRESREC